MREGAVLLSYFVYSSSPGYYVQLTEQTILLAALTFMTITFRCLEASWLTSSSSCSIEIINVVDFEPLERSVHIGCLDCSLLKACIEMAVASPAADGRACRSLSESFGA